MYIVVFFYILTTIARHFTCNRSTVVMMLICFGICSPDNISHIYCDSHITYHSLPYYLLVVGFKLSKVKKHLLLRLQQISTSTVYTFTVTPTFNFSQHSISKFKIFGLLQGYFFGSVVWLPK